MLTYIAVSLRKWMGVASGCVLLSSEKGTFGVKPIPIIKTSFPLEIRLFNPERPTSITVNEDYNKEGNDVFWKAEFMLREIFDIQEGMTASL